ncbi:unnamed protein product [Symbiodinium sp. KB8]|nr:unnamed protein product [Symbiodinium sp. KB8]
MMFWKVVAGLSLSFVAEAGQLNAVSISAIGTDGQPVISGSPLQAIDIGFQTVSAGTTEATIVLPSGLITVSGSDAVNLTFTSAGGTTVTYTTTTVTTTTYDSDTSDANETTTSTTLVRRLEARGPRRLAGTCDVTGASIASDGLSMTLFLEDASSPGNPCPAGSTVSTSVTADSGLQASFNNAPAGSISFSVSSNVDQVTVPVVLSQDGNGGFSVSVVGDPITWYGGKKIKFWFPNYKLMPMLQTPEMTIWASTFEGPTLDYQWFERFVVTTPGGTELVDIKVRHSDPGMNRSHFNRGDFRQLDIRLQGGRSLRRHSQKLFGSADGKVKIGVGARVYHPPRVHFTPLVEFVMVESDSISFMVHASHAGAEFPDDIGKQVKYTHLDWINLEMVQAKRFTGVLPQLWGTIPRTPEVEEMLAHGFQSKAAAAVCCVCSAEVDSSVVVPCCPWFQGGNGGSRPRPAGGCAGWVSRGGISPFLPRAEDRAHTAVRAAAAWKKLGLDRQHQYQKEALEVHASSFDGLEGIACDSADDGQTMAGRIDNAATCDEEHINAVLGFNTFRRLGQVVQEAAPSELEAERREASAPAGLQELHERALEALKAAVQRRAAEAIARAWDREEKYAETPPAAGVPQASPQLSVTSVGDDWNALVFSVGSNGGIEEDTVETLEAVKFLPGSAVEV